MSPPARPGGRWRLGDLALLALTLALAAPPLAAWALDAVGVSLRWVPIVAALVVAVAVALGPVSLWEQVRVRASGTGREGIGTLAAASLSFAIVLAASLRLAWPTLLPVSTSVDEVNNFLLADYIYRHLRLPSGDEAASLVEMDQYPFAPHLLIALLARGLGVSPAYLLHPVAAFTVASLAAFGAATIGGRRGLLVVPMLLWPGAYTLGQITNDFFLGHVFGLACLTAALCWTSRGSRVALGLAGVGMLFSYPTLLPVAALGALVGWPGPRRALLVPAAAIAALAGFYLVPRAATGIGVVQQGGVALSPSFATLPPLFVAVGVVGLAFAARSAPTRAVAAFAIAGLGQFALLVATQGLLSRYVVDKAIYTLVPLLTVAAAFALVLLLERGRRLAVLLLVGIALGGSAPHVAASRLPSLRLELLGISVPGEPVYFTDRHLEAYWVEIGLLKRDRTAAALPRFHDRVRAPDRYFEWVTATQDGPIAVLFSEGRLPIADETAVIQRAGDLTIVRRADGPRPSYRWLGGSFVLLSTEVVSPRVLPGQPIVVEARLAAIAPEASEHALVGRLRQGAGGQTYGESAVALPRHVAPGSTVRLELPVAAIAPPGAYRVDLLLFRTPAWDVVPARTSPAHGSPPTDLTVGPVTVAPADLLPTSGAPARPIGALFGNTIELVGVDHPAPGELTLIWRAARRVDRDYTVFVHAVDETGRVVAQADGHAWSGAYPTSAWLPGHAIRDVRRLPITADRVLIGLYRLDTGERLPVATGGDHVAIDLPR